MWRTSEEGNYWDKKYTAVGEISYYFGADSISKEVAGFYPLWFPRGKNLCSLSLMLIVVLVILSIGDPKIMLA